MRNLPEGLYEFPAIIEATLNHVLCAEDCWFRETCLLITIQCGHPFASTIIIIIEGRELTIVTVQ